MRCIYLLLILIVPMSAFAQAAPDSPPQNGFKWPESLQTPVDQALLAQEESIRDNIAGLSAADLLVRNQAFDRIKLRRLQTIDGLLTLVKSKGITTSFGGPLHRAIVLLGEYRAVQAVPDLSERLTYLPDGGAAEFTGEASESYYPAAQALATIGQPAVPSMVRVVAYPPDELSTKLALWVLMEVEGKDQASHRFEELAKNAPDADRRARYKTAKDYILSYVPDRSSPYLEPAKTGAEAGQQTMDPAAE